MRFWIKDTLNCLLDNDSQMVIMNENYNKYFNLLLEFPIWMNCLENTLFTLAQQCFLQHTCHC